MFLRIAEPSKERPHIHTFLTLKLQVQHTDGTITGSYAQITLPVGKQPPGLQFPNALRQRLHPLHLEYLKLKRLGLAENRSALFGINLLTVSLPLDELESISRNSIVLARLWPPVAA